MVVLLDGLYRCQPTGKPTRSYVSILLLFQFPHKPKSSGGILAMLMTLYTDGLQSNSPNCLSGSY